MYHVRMRTSSCTFISGLVILHQEENVKLEHIDNSESQKSLYFKRYSIQLIFWNVSDGTVCLRDKAVEIHRITKKEFLFMAVCQMKCEKIKVTRFLPLKTMEEMFPFKVMSFFSLAIHIKFFSFLHMTFRVFHN